LCHFIEEHLTNYFGPTFNNHIPRHDAPANLDWCRNSPLQHENPQQPYDNAILSDQAAVNWISDPSEINWLSVFPFVEGFGDPPL
jgi:hypothetical protein